MHYAILPLDVLDRGVAVVWQVYIFLTNISDSILLSTQSQRQLGRITLNFIASMCFVVNIEDL